MARGSRWIGVGLGGLGALALAGCLTGNSAALMRDGLASDAATEESAPRLARSQQPESGVSLRKPVSLPAPDGSPAPAPEENTQQTSMSTKLSPGGIMVTVRAWVNGKPIFEDEVFYVLQGDLRQLQNLPEPTRSERLHAMIAEKLDLLIDQELLYQDGVTKLEKANPRALDQLKDYVTGEFERQLAKMEKAGVPKEHIREIEPVARRVTQRSMISMEYARSRIMPWVKGTVGLEMIKDYYENHKNEFQTVDKVKWQDIFLAAGPGTRHATVADARRFAEGLRANCKTADDFNKLLQYDEGDSKLRGGEGLGQRRGEIVPALLEDMLFQMRDGEIGPIVEMPSGIHLVRLVKRDYAGQVPLNDETQRQIRRKLEGQLADRESKMIIRQLRARAIIRKENPS